MAANDPNPTTTRAVLYAAKSTEDKHGSIPGQLQDGRTLAEREAWEVVGEYQDESVSAYSGNRGEGLADAKAHAERLAREHGSCALIVQHSDRLARGDGIVADHLVEHVLWGRRVGVRWASVQDPQTFDGMGLVYAALMGDRNHEDSKRKSQATRDGKRRRFERGEQVGGPVPDGYAKDWTIKTDRADIIRRIFDRAWEGAADSTIARELNEDGLRTQRNGPFSRRRINDTLSNPFYAGFITRLGEVRPGSHEPLIDRERFTTLQEIRKDRGAKHRGPWSSRPGRSTDRYVLAKLAVCARCGARMYATTDKWDDVTPRKYLCANVARGAGLCDAPKVNAEIVDNAFVDDLRKDILDHDEWVVQMRASRERAQEATEKRLETLTAELRAALSLLGKSEAYLLDRLEKGEDPDLAQRAFDRQKAKVSDIERAIVTREVDRTGEQPGPGDAELDFYLSLRESLRDAIASDEIARVNEKLRTLFASVRIDTTGKGSAFVAPDGGPYIVMKPTLRPDVGVRLSTLRSIDPPPLRQISAPRNGGKHEGPYDAFRGVDTLLEMPDLVVPKTIARHPKAA